MQYNVALEITQLSGEHHKEKSRRNMGLNHLISRDDWEDFVCSIKWRCLSYVNIYVA